MRNINTVRVLYIVGTLDLGGIETLVRDWCKSLHGKGFECIVLCIMEKRGAYMAEIEAMGVRVMELRQAQYSMFGFIYRFIGIVKNIKPDVIHSQCSWSLPQQAISARLGGAKNFMLTVHSTYARGNNFHRLIRRISMRLARHYIYKIIGVSEVVSTYAREYLYLPYDKVMTIPNGIFLDRFSLPSGNKLNTRKELGLTGTLVVTVGSLSVQKDHMTILKAAKLLQPHIPNLKFIIVGAGPLLHRLKEYVQKNRIQDTVVFMGRRTDIPRILQACDLFVLSSRREGFSLVLVEAQAAGLPVIATKVGGIPEVVQDGCTGMLVSGGDVKALVTAIEGLITHPQKAVWMGRRGKRAVRKRFDINLCAGKYAQLYQSMVTKNKVE